MRKFSLYTISIELVDIKIFYPKKGFDMKIIKQTIALSILSVTLTFASINNDTDYSMMSTVELEKEVELLSINGDLPFEMGIELLKRWKES